MDSHSSICPEMSFDLPSTVGSKTIKRGILFYEENLLITARSQHQEWNHDQINNQGVGTVTVNVMLNNSGFRMF